MAKRITQAAWDAKRAKAKAKAREALSEQPEDELANEPDDTTGQPEGSTEAEDYSEWSDEELIEESTARELSIVGTREDLINRLEEDDSAQVTE